MGATKVKTKDEVQQEFLRILDQGTTALQRVVRAYEVNRTPERDRNWLALQTGKEFGAIMLQYGRAMDLIDRGAGVGPISSLVGAIIEEAEHYSGYAKILGTVSPPDAQAVEGMYDYVRVAAVEEGAIKLDTKMRAAMSIWPENGNYFNLSLNHMSEVTPWGRRAIGAQLEGGAVGWHWAMSEMEPVDDFLRAVVEHERSIVDDELHHGPEEIRPLVDAYGEAEGEEVERLMQIIRELRYQEVRQRNEQFLYPIAEEEIVELGRQLLEDELEPTPLFSRAMAEA